MANYIKIPNGLTLGFTPTVANPSTDQFLLRSYTSGDIVRLDSIPVNKLEPLDPLSIVSTDASGFLDTGAITTSITEINYITGATSNIQTQINNIVGFAPLTPLRAVATDGSGALIVSATTATELGYSSGVISAIQPQLNSKQPLITGGASSITSVDLTPSMALISNTSGKVAVSPTTSTELTYVHGVLSPIQTQLNTKLTANIIGPVAGSILYWTGSTWTNFNTDGVGEILSWNGTALEWISPAINGIPIGGTINQVLIKNSGTNYDAGWHTLLLADVTDVTASVAEVNVLDGITASTTELNFVDGVTSSIQVQFDNKLDRSLAYNALFVGDAANIPVQLPTGADGTILKSVNGVPVWQPETPPGNVSGVAPTTDNAITRWNGILGDSIQNSGVIIDDSNNITGATSISSGQHNILNQAAVRLYETGSTNYVALRASAVMAADYTITLPAAAPSTGNALVWDGANYVWTTPAGITTFVALTDGPGTMAGQGGKGIRVNAGATALEYYTLTASGTVTSVTGTTNRITITGTPTIAPVVDIAATYVGQTSITTLGTVGTGTWNASNISLAKGGTGASLVDPNADRLMFWDDSAGAVDWLTPGTTLAVTTTTIDVADGSITNTKLRDSSGLSVIGRSINSTGIPADIVASNPYTILRRDGTNTLAFGTIDNNYLTNNAITFALGSAGTAPNWLVSAVALGQTATLNIPYASATAHGIINNTAQTIAGVKTFTSAPFLSSMTSGSVLFAGVSGEISQDSSNLVFDNANNTLGVGTFPSANNPIETAKNVDAVARIRVDNQNTGTSAASGFYTTSAVSYAGAELTGSGYIATNFLSNQYVLYTNGANGILQYTQSAAPIVFATNHSVFSNGERMRITPTGNVGIGVNAPTARLQVYGANNATALFVGDDAGARIIQAGETAGARYFKLDLGSDATGDLHYRNASGDLIRLPVGLSGQSILSVSGVPTWSNTPVEDVTTTTYSIVDADNGKFKRFTNAAGCTVTIPTGLMAGFSAIIYRGAGAGTITFSSLGTLEAAGATIDTAQTGASIYHRGSNVHVVLGAVGAGGGGGGGSVTSVALSLPGIFAVSGSPVTSTGTLTGTLNTQLANIVWAGPTSGGASVPTFRGLVLADQPTQVIEDVTATTYSFVEADRYKVKRFTHASGCATTIPNGLTTGWSVTAYRALGAGVVSFAATGTYEGVGNTLPTPQTAASILHRGGNVQVVVGALVAPGAGISNSAATDEVMKSDGTNAVPSGVFSPSPGNLTLGSASVSGGRSIVVDSSSANASMTFQQKGDGDFIWILNETTPKTVSLQGITSGGSMATITNSTSFADGAIGIGTAVASISDTARIGGLLNQYIEASRVLGTSTALKAVGTDGPGAGLPWTIQGAAAVGTNQNGGNVIIRAGAKTGSGLDSNVRIETLTGYLIIATIPTSAAGLPSGAVWSNSNILTRVP